MGFRGGGSRAGESLGRATRDANWVAANAAGGDVTNVITGEVVIPPSGMIVVTAGAFHLSSSLVGASHVTVQEAPVVDGVVGAFADCAIEWIRSDVNGQGAGGPKIWQPLERAPGAKFVYKLRAGNVSGNGIVTLLGSAASRIFLDILAR